MPLNNLPFDPHSNSRSRERPRVALTIGGSDPTGGAGIQADLKTFQHFGVHGLSAITAVTVQNTSGVLSKNPIGAELIKEQLYALACDIEIDAIKIGMLTSADVVRTVAKFIRLQKTPTVLDPILASSNGVPFLDDDAFEVLRNELLPLVTIVTPNVPETIALTGLELSSDESFIQAALLLNDMGAKATLVKGGHAEGELSRDLFYDGLAIEWIEAPRIAKQVHGTGCALSSAIASGLAIGKSLRDAAHDAKQFIGSMLGHTSPLGAGQQIFEFPPFSIN